jgi:poly(3-hydroxybutyrate) depolymerase
MRRASGYAQAMVFSPALVLTALALVPTDIPQGSAELELDLQGTKLQVFTYKPEAWRGERMLLVFHGVLRNADEYRDHAKGMGDRFGALIVAPKFDADRFPSWRYQRGGIVGPGGKSQEPKDWTYALVPQLAAAIRARENKPSLKHWIIGHSAGGQFAMRMSAFQDTGAERIVAGNPGTDLFPTREMEFGLGFGKLPESLASDEQLRKYLAAPLTIYLGTADNKPDEYFDESEAAMKQGGGRWQRGKACFAAGQSLAREKGWPFAWRLVEATGIGHDHDQMFDHPQCAVALFGEAVESRPASRPESPPQVTR